MADNLLFTNNDATSSNNTLTKRLDTFPFVAKDMEISLATLFVSYLWNNISASYGNNTWSYSFNGTTRGPYTIPDGQYQVEDISGVMQQQMLTNGDYTLDASGTPVYYVSMVGNRIYNSCTVTCSRILLAANGSNPSAITLSGNVPLLIFGAGLASVLGYTGPITLPSVTQATTYMANSTKNPQLSPIYFVSLNTDLVANAQFNMSLPSSIYTFSPNVKAGSQVAIDVTNQRWYRITDGIYRSITVSLSAQDSSAVPLKDPNWGCTLQFRKRPTQS